MTTPRSPDEPRRRNAAVRRGSRGGGKRLGDTIDAMVQQYQTRPATGLQLEAVWTTAVEWHRSDPPCLPPGP
jgi:hypothetical protein